MKAILNVFWGICLLRQSPALVPGSGPFVTVIVIANVVVSTLVSLGMPSEAGVLQTATGILVSQAVTASLVWLALTARNLASRFMTTLAALFGCDLIITGCFALVLPLAVSVGPSLMNATLLLFLVWSVAVAGFILHRALAVHLAIGIGFALGISLVSVSLSQLAMGA
jgi:hypothetical protein